MKKNIFKSSAIVLITLFFSSCSMEAPQVPNCTIGPITVTNQPASVHYAGYWPDGKLNLVKNNTTWELFWGEAVSIKTTSTTPWPENHYSSLKASNVVFGKGITPIENFNEDGSWFIGVFPLNETGRYIGFFHAESHWPNTDTAHKSIGVTYSNDYGKTWEAGEPIILDKNPKPSSPSWSGLGDGCVIKIDNNPNYKWICYYQGKISSGANVICMAASNDDEAKAGTWKKWNGNKFSIEARNMNSTNYTGGQNYPIENLQSKGGANPSVMWNTFLNQWVMVYHGWDPRVVYISYSNDAINWSYPYKVIGSASDPIWYPNLISSQGDKIGGQDVRLYFSYQQGANGKRKLAYCTLHFTGRL